MRSVAGARESLERKILLGPAWVRRAAAGRAPGARERWMLTQTKEVRRSYVTEVIDAPGDPEVLGQIWMMRQSDSVRDSYVEEVLESQV